MASYLKKMCLQAQAAATDWELFIGPLMFATNTAVNKSTMLSAHYVMLGYDPRVPLWPEFPLLSDEDDPIENLRLPPPLVRHQQMQQLCRQQAYANNVHYKDVYLEDPEGMLRTPVTYAPGDHVWLKVKVLPRLNPKLQPRWEEAVVKAQVHRDVYDVVRTVIPTKKRGPQRRSIIRVNVRDLKRRVGAQDAEEAAPRTRAAPPPIPPRRDPLADFLGPQPVPDSDDEDFHGFPTDPAPEPNLRQLPQWDPDDLSDNDDGDDDIDPYVDLISVIQEAAHLLHITQLSHLTTAAARDMPRPVFEYLMSSIMSLYHPE
jgi:hypothetical protein